LFVRDKAFVELTLWTFPAGQRVWLRCLRETAEFYGWYDAFPHSDLPADPAELTRQYVNYSTKRFRPEIGGKKLRICRSNDRNGYPAGKTNRFRVSGNCTNRNLLDVAMNTSIPFGWMETFGQQRKSFDWWMNYGISGRIPA